MVLLEDHVVVEEDFLAPILSPFQDPSIFAVGSRLMEADYQVAPSVHGKTRGRISNGEIQLWQSPWTGADIDLQAVLWVSIGGCSAYNKAKLLELDFDGLFIDRKLADIDLCLRAWKRGWKVLVEPKSVTYRHSAGQITPASAIDIVESDQLVFNWKSLGSASSLLRYQLSLGAKLLSDATRHRLNLRPLRYALRRLPHLLGEASLGQVSTELSTERVLCLSSHRYFLQRREVQKLTPRQLTSTESQNAPPGRQDNAQIASKGLGDTLRLLLVCPQLPYPPTHGSAVRMWNLLRTLAARHTVDVLSFTEPTLSTEEISASLDQLHRYCHSVRLVSRQPSSDVPHLLDRSIHVEMFDCPEMREALLDMVDSGDYDIIQYDKTEMGQYAIPGPAPVQVLVEHVIFYHAYRRQFLVSGRRSAAHLLDYLKLRRYELDVCRKFDGVITMSPIDTQFLGSRLPSHPCIVDVANGVDTNYYRPASKMAAGNDILFIGNFDHSPNVDGIRFLLRAVFPTIKKSIPDARLFIVGPGPYNSLPEVTREASAIATGLVDDIRPYMEQCAVFVAPILAGSGTRLKILETMAAGMAIVSTTIGAEGLDASSGVHLLIADNPQAFAAATITLLQDPELRLQLGHKARELVDGGYNWQTIGARLEKVYRDLLAKHRS